MFETIETEFKKYVMQDADANMALGGTDFLGDLGDPSLESAEARHKEALALLEKIRACKGETFDQTLDLELMERSLALDGFFHGLTQHGEPQRRRAPHGVDGISAGIFQLFVNDERSPSERLDNILSRLQQAPAYLEAERQVLLEPITRWKEIELIQGEGIPSLFDTIANWAEQEQYSKLDELKKAIENCNHALADYLQDLGQRKSFDSFQIGEEKVQELLALRNINRTPSELAKMAADFMAETKALLNDLTQRLNNKYNLPEGTSQAELHEHLNEAFAAKLKDGKLDSVLDYYYSEMDSIQSFINDQKLFDIPAAQNMKIMQTPSFLEPVIPAGAMWPPLALREGNKTSLVYLTLKEDELAEHTELGIPVMMIHEGIPGHHLQFATAALHPSFVRRIYGANEHAEGWTTMLEDYMIDQGYIAEDLVDEVRFIAKREMSRLVARVGIDLYFMTGNKAYLEVGLELDFDSEDPFENAAKLLKEATGFTDGRVQAELNWYSTEQGYPLSYLTGNRMVWEMKQEIESKNLKQLSQLELDQAFHKVYLTSGCMPVNNLRDVFTHHGYL